MGACLSDNPGAGGPLKIQPYFWEKKICSHCNTKLSEYEEWNGRITYYCLPCAYPNGKGPGYYERRGLGC